MAETGFAPPDGGNWVTNPPPDILPNLNPDPIVVDCDVLPNFNTTVRIAYAWDGIPFEVPLTFNAGNLVIGSWEGNVFTAGGVIEPPNSNFSVNTLIQRAQPGQIPWVVTMSYNEDPNED